MFGQTARLGICVRWTASQKHGNALRDVMTLLHFIPNYSLPCSPYRSFLREQ